MSTQRRHRRPSPIRRRAALATAVISALAIAAPVAGASAATPVAVDRSARGAEFAFGGYSIGNVFNGGTAVIVSTGSALGVAEPAFNSGNVIVSP
jgi:hypothetical protein